MSSEAKWTITTGLAIATLMAALSGIEHLRIGDVRNRVSSAESTLSGRIESAESTLSGRIESAESTLSGRIDTAETRLSGRIDTAETNLNNRFNAAVSGVDSADAAAFAREVDALNSDIATLQVLVSCLIEIASEMRGDQLGAVPSVVAPTGGEPAPDSPEVQPEPNPENSSLLTGLVGCPRPMASR